jgi:hypothetical protein
LPDDEDEDDDDDSYRFFFEASLLNLNVGFLGLKSN